MKIENDYIEMTLKELGYLLSDKFDTKELYESSMLVQDMKVGGCGRILQNYRNPDVFFLSGFLDISAYDWIKKVLKDESIKDLVIRCRNLHIEYTEDIDCTNKIVQRSINISYDRKL